MNVSRNAWLKEVGLVRRMHATWIPPKPLCLPQQLYANVSVESLLIAYIILIIGLILSPVILLIELTISKKNRKIITLRHINN